MRGILVLTLLVLALVTSSCVMPYVVNEGSPSAATSSVTIRGVDLHDGMIVQVGSVYYLYGTQYACGYGFMVKNSPWCGFGVAISTDLRHWSPITTLFSPHDISPHSGKTWLQVCGETGQGCFNPRMIQRSGWGSNDGLPILWFNAPRDFPGANAYWSMTCTSLVGPCGSPVKPNLKVCTDNGDFSIVSDVPRAPMIFCTMRDQTLNSERLDDTGRSGTGVGQKRLAGAIKSESPGAYRDRVSGLWILTFNELNCGYCSGAPTSYATAAAVDQEFVSPPTTPPGWGATPLGRRGISATSCGGQSRTIVQLNGHPYQLIDLWVGTPNETRANVHLEPLTYLGDSPFAEPHQPFEPWTCGT